MESCHLRPRALWEGAPAVPSRAPRGTAVSPFAGGRIFNLFLRLCNQGEERGGRHSPLPPGILCEPAARPVRFHPPWASPPSGRGLLTGETGHALHRDAPTLYRPTTALPASATSNPTRLPTTALRSSPTSADMCRRGRGPVNSCGAPRPGSARNRPPCVGRCLCVGLRAAPRPTGAAAGPTEEAARSCTSARTRFGR